VNISAAYDCLTGMMASYVEAVRTLAARLAKKKKK
jgi:hypothetical protein